MSDLHMHLAAEDPITAAPRAQGLAALVPLIEAARADAVGDVVLLDNGDGLQGTPMAEWHARCGRETPNPLRAALARLNCAVTTLGNHEFDFGLDYLAKVLGEPGPAVVCCNLDWPGHPVSEGIVLDAGPLKIGVTGVVPPRIHVWHRRLLEGAVRASDPVPAVAKAAAGLRARGADLVICLCHGGIVPEGHPEEARENPARAIAASGTVDALITGHQHLRFPDPAFPYQEEGIDPLTGALHGVPTVMPPALGRGIGLLDLRLARSKRGIWTVTEHHAELRDATEVLTGGTLDDIIAPAQRNTARRLDAPLSHTSVPLWTAHATLEDTPAMRLIQQAQLWYMRQHLQRDVPHLAAASPFRAGGRNGPEAYTRIPAGPLTRRSVADLYPYENPFVALKVTGRMVRDWLEMSAG
ncbi:MAG: 5'-nucleotidase C-terminal domain-containing protein, partial [Pseudomonadota bacterium]